MENFGENYGKLGEISEEIRVGEFGKILGKYAWELGRIRREFRENTGKFDGNYGIS